MKQKTGKFLTFWLLIIVMIATSACAGDAQDAEKPTLEPIVYVTQYITQVVATSPPATLTPIPTFTKAPAAPSSSTGWDPLSQPIYYPLTGCYASRLYVGNTAFVANISGVAGFYLGKDIFFDPLIRKPTPGEIVEIIDGPWCHRNVLVWKVYSEGDGKTAFMPEGDGKEYWLLPQTPYTATPKKP